mgnify:CR=1 FL=1
MQTLIHRGNLAGQAACGAAGRVRISASGASSAITCPACKPGRYIDAGGPGEVVRRTQQVILGLRHDA